MEHDNLSLIPQGAILQEKGGLPNVIDQIKKVFKSEPLCDLVISFIEECWFLIGREKLIFRSRVRRAEAVTYQGITARRALLRIKLKTILRQLDSIIRELILIGFKKQE